MTTLTLLLILTHLLVGYGCYKLGYILGQTRTIKVVNAAMKVLQEQLGGQVQLYSVYDDEDTEESIDEHIEKNSKKTKSLKNKKILH